MAHKELPMPSADKVLEIAHKMAEDAHKAAKLTGAPTQWGVALLQKSALGGFCSKSTSPSMGEVRFDKLTMSGFRAYTDWSGLIETLDLSLSKDDFWNKCHFWCKANGGSPGATDNFGRSYTATSSSTSMDNKSKSE